MKFWDRVRKWVRRIKPLGWMSPIAACLAACSAAPAPQRPDAAPDGPAPIFIGTDRAALACTNMGKIQCIEGLRPNCADVARQRESERITGLPLDCLAAATTKEAARACGVECP